jgi:hypothetical protein
MEGTTVKNPKLAKMVVKGVASVLISTFIGYTVKVGKKIDERIDQHYTVPEPESDQDN